MLQIFINSSTGQPNKLNIFLKTSSVRNLMKEQDILYNASPFLGKNEGSTIQNGGHDSQKAMLGSKLLILLLVFLMAGVLSGIGLIYLFSDSEEDARDS